MTPCIKPLRRFQSGAILDFNIDFINIALLVDTFDIKAIESISIYIQLHFTSRVQKRDLTIVQTVLRRDIELKSAFHRQFIVEAHPEKHFSGVLLSE